MREEMSSTKLSFTNLGVGKIIENRFIPLGDQRRIMESGEEKC